VIIFFACALTHSCSATQEMTPGTTFKLHFQLDICSCVSDTAQVWRANSERRTICRRADINYFNIDAERWMFYYFTTHTTKCNPSPPLLIAGRYHRIWIIVFPREWLHILCGNNCGDARDVTCALWRPRKTPFDLA